MQTHAHRHTRTCACERNLHFTAIYIPLHKCTHVAVHTPGLIHANIQTYLFFKMPFICVCFPLYLLIQNGRRSLSVTEIPKQRPGLFFLDFKVRSPAILELHAPVLPRAAAHANTHTHSTPKWQTSFLLSVCQRQLPPVRCTPDDTGEGKKERDHPQKHSCQTHTVTPEICPASLTSPPPPRRTYTHSCMDPHAKVGFQSEAV